jgi:hypothetical protein
MGTDDLFKRKKLAGANALKRQKQLLESYDNVLIVCEGEKTEPYYLKAVREHFGLAQANVKIDPKSDSSPTSVVRYAKTLIKESSASPYDHVYCVIDRDRHADFQKAVDQVNGFKSKDTKLHLIVSYPCFEYWILLHYIYITKAFGVSGESPCDELISTELKNYIPEYEKGNASIMIDLVENQLGTALANAKKSFDAAEQTGIDNPKTEMHILVEYLKNLKN